MKAVLTEDIVGLNDGGNALAADYGRQYDACLALCLLENNAAPENRCGY